MVVFTELDGEISRELQFILHEFANLVMHKLACQLCVCFLYPSNCYALRCHQDVQYHVKRLDWVSNLFIFSRLVGANCFVIASSYRASYPSYPV